MESPGGSVPLSAKERVADGTESEAFTVTGVMAVPETSFWSPGLVTVTVLVMVQVNEAWAEKPALSATVTVTG